MLDVRPFEAHAAGHLPRRDQRSRHRRPSFGTKAGFVLDAGEPVVLHARSSPRRLSTAAWKLWAVGMLDLRLRALALDATETLATVRRRRAEAPAREGDVQLVDVRETTERDDGYIPGSRNIPYRLLRKLGCGALDARGRS